MFLEIMGVDVIKGVAEFAILTLIYHYYVRNGWQDSALAGFENFLASSVSEAIILPHVSDHWSSLASSGVDVFSSLVFALVRTTFHDTFFTVGGFIRAFLISFISNLSGFYISKTVAGMTPATALEFENKGHKKKKKMVAGSETPRQQRESLETRAAPLLF